VPGQEVRVIPEWAQHLAGAMLLGFCFSIAMQDTKRRALRLPSAEKQAELKPLNTDRHSSELQEFIDLPPNIQRQVLDYARNWIDAGFEEL
jgi:hypothetical protein